jgi:6-pyruvoyltetrahydropterin/6-carboxytetrahydropterin synthase
LICKGEQLHEAGSKSGMLVDFSDMKSAIKPLLEEYLDHYHLNDSLKLESPTSELVAQWIFRKLKDKLPQLSAVVIEETCTSLCRYEEEK